MKNETNEISVEDLNILIEGEVDFSEETCQLSDRAIEKLKQYGLRIK